MNKRKYNIVLVLMIVSLLVRQILLIDSLNIIIRSSFSYDLIYISISLITILLLSILLYIIPSLVYIKVSINFRLPNYELPKVNNREVSVVYQIDISIKNIQKHYQVFRCWNQLFTLDNKTTMKGWIWKKQQLKQCLVY